jgi:pentatricopeptide repeat protein
MKLPECLLDVTVTGALNACHAVLIDMCIKCGRSGDAHLLLEQWRHQESFHIAWNSLLVASVRDSEYEKALSTFLQMFRSSGVEFMDEFVLTAALGVCGALGFAELGKKMHSFAAKSGLLNGCGVGNAIISMYGKCGECEN